jgi:hypothetical protein
MQKPILVSTAAQAAAHEKIKVLARSQQIHEYHSIIRKLANMKLKSKQDFQRLPISREHLAKFMSTVPAAPYCIRCGTVTN